MYAYARNNPNTYSDATGNWPKLSKVFTTIAATAAVVATAAVCVVAVGMAAPALAGGAALLAGSTAYAATVATAAAAVSVAAMGTAAIADVVERSKNSTSKGHTVYTLTDEKGTVQYVGRTVNPQKREKAHMRNPFRAHLKFEVIASDLSAEAARGIEQIEMLYYHTLNTSNKMNNQINGISPNNKNLLKYMEAGRGALKYTENQISNEILYWTGQ